MIGLELISLKRYRIDATHAQVIHHAHAKTAKRIQDLMAHPKLQN